MKKITCEMCGSNDLLKQDGVYVCQSCSSKYTVEEAKKLMIEIEGAVDVSGSTVKIDTSAKLDNLYKAARRAKDDDNVDQAFKYYEHIVLENPNCWEAVFYVAYYSARQNYRNSKTGTAISLIQGCLDSVFSIIENIQDVNEQEKAASEVVDQITEICEILHKATEKERRETLAELDRYEFNAKIKKLRDENIDRRDMRNKSIAEIQITAGFRLLELFGSYSNLGKIGVSMVNEGIRIIDNYIDYYFKKREKKELIHSYKTRGNEISAATAQRRKEEYWRANQSEKEKLEKERDSLKTQIENLENKISEIPQNTDGYTNMLEYQKEIENLESEKKALGILKFKDRKAVQEKIDAVYSKIKPIQSRIDSSIAEIKNQIHLLENKIKEINDELTKPR